MSRSAKGPPLEDIRVAQPGHPAGTVDEAAPAHAAAQGRPGTAAEVPPGMLMEKLIPADLVQPYLTSQRSVLTGFVRRVPAQGSGGRAGPGLLPRRDAAEIWLLRWRALAMQTYTERRGRGRGAAAELFLLPCPVPVGTEMYRVTTAGEEFIARHDGQAWLAPGG